MNAANARRKTPRGSSRRQLVSKLLFDAPLNAAIFPDRLIYHGERLVRRQSSEVDSLVRMRSIASRYSERARKQAHCNRRRAQLARRALIGFIAMLIAALVIVSRGDSADAPTWRWIAILSVVAYLRAARPLSGQAALSAIAGNIVAAGGFTTMALLGFIDRPVGFGLAGLVLIVWIYQTLIESRADRALGPPTDDLSPEISRAFRKRSR